MWGKDAGLPPQSYKNFFSRTLLMRRDRETRCPSFCDFRVAALSSALTSFGLQPLMLNDFVPDETFAVFVLLVLALTTFFAFALTRLDLDTFFLLFLSFVFAIGISPLFCWFNNCSTSREHRGNRLVKK